MLRRAWIVFTLLLGMAWPCRAALLASDVISRARTYLSDQATNANRQYFTDAILLGWISDGQREANGVNWLIQGSATNATEVNTCRVNIGPNFMAMIRLYYTNNGTTQARKLDQTSFEELDAKVPGWRTATGTPTKYLVDYSGAVDPALVFYPCPAVAASTGTYTLYYVLNTTDLTATSDQPFNALEVLEPYSSYLAYYAAYRGFLALQEPDLAKEYLALWNNGLLTMRQGLARQPDYNPPAAGNRGP